MGKPAMADAGRMGLRSARRQGQVRVLQDHSDAQLASRKVTKSTPFTTIALRRYVEAFTVTLDEPIITVTARVAVHEPSGFLRNASHGTAAEGEDGDWTCAATWADAPMTSGPIIAAITATRIESALNASMIGSEFGTNNVRCLARSPQRPRQAVPTSELPPRWPRAQ
jgi:hypothetical protein